MPRTGRGQQAKIWQLQAETAAMSEAWRELDVEVGRSEKQAVMVLEFRSYGNGKPLTNQAGVVAT